MPQVGNKSISREIILVAESRDQAGQLISSFRIITHISWDDPNQSEYILDGLSKFAYSLTEYFPRWEDLAQLLAEEKQPWEKAKGISPKVSAFADKVVEYAKSVKC